MLRGLRFLRSQRAQSPSSGREEREREIGRVGLHHPRSGRVNESLAGDAISAVSAAPTTVAVYFEQIHVCAVYFE